MYIYSTLSSMVPESRDNGKYNRASDGRQDDIKIKR
jgi:hypothetical protein